ncbi:MAG: stalk domain-containing protein [Nitrososphaeria archaeon]
MKVKPIVAILLFMFLISMALPVKGEVGVEVKNITITPPVVNVYALYSFQFLIHQDLYANADSVFIKFPNDFVFPFNLNKDYKNFFGTISASSVRIVGNNTIAVSPSKDFRISDGYGNFPIVLNILDLNSIKTPAKEGIYYFEIWTSKEMIHSTYGCYIGLSSNGNTVSNVTASLSSYIAGKPSEYRISFMLSNNGALVFEKSDYVVINFPENASIPDNAKRERVIFNRQYPSRVEKVGNSTLKIFLPENYFIPSSSICEIVFLQDFGILNPEFTGDYFVLVSTSKDLGNAPSNVFKIVSTQISELSIKATPSYQMANSELSFSFKTSLFNESGLIAGKSKINIKFPPDFSLPDLIIPGAILINGVPATNVNIKSGILTIVSPLNISNNSNVNVVIKREFGIKNPKDVGVYIIFVNTSQDAEFVPVSVNITYSVIEDVTVKLSNNSAGQVAEYNISFKTGVAGGLLPGVGKIVVVFPIGTTIPSVISNSAVTVNGILTTLVEVSGTTVSVTIPIEIGSMQNIELVFMDTAGLRNPVQEGTYSLKVYTSKELTPVESNKYSIESVPQTTISLNPVSPDGTNGYYRTPPLITFSSISPIDPNPKIYYYFDNNSPVLFTNSPIVPPEGIHTLSYYALDKEGHKESTKTITIKLDTIPPPIVIISPEDGSVVNSKRIVVKGITEKDCFVKINGAAAKVDEFGKFEGEVELENGYNQIQVESVDLASNSNKVVFTVNLDLSPPILTVISPKMFENIFKLPLIVEGRVNEESKVFVNDFPATVNEDNTFAFQIKSLSKGSNSIKIVAVDKAGNTSTQSIVVNYSGTLSIFLKIDVKQVLVNGNLLEIDVPPMIINGRTLVPLRFLSESFGAEVNYNDKTKTITIDYGKNKIILTVGKKVASVNGKTYSLDVAPVIYNGRTLVPIRFISEIFGADVVWDGTSKTIIITYPKIG